MKPTPKNKLIPQIQFTTQIELSDQQIAALNHLILGSKELADDEAQDLWQALNPWVEAFNHGNPRDMFASLRVVALAQPSTTESEPPYPVELLNSVRSDIAADLIEYC